MKLVRNSKILVVVNHDQELFQQFVTLDAPLASNQSRFKPHKLVSTDLLYKH